MRIDIVLQMKGYLCIDICSIRIHVFNSLFIDKDQEFTPNHLPPIILGFQLPEDYPVYGAPLYKLTCNWLTEAQVEPQFNLILKRAI